MIARMETSATAAAATSAPRLRLAKRSLFDPMIVRSALPQSLRKLAPRVQARNPVMLVVLVGAVITTLAFLRDLASSTAQENVFNGLVAAFLWFTVLFANFAEAMAEGRGKAQAAALRKVRSETMANRRTAAGNIESVPSSRLDLDDVVEVSAGETIPSDGEIIEGIASVDESAITGESAPVIRESGGDRSAVTGGTVVLSDRIVVRITAKQGQTFIDRMIALVEGAARQQTPNEIALNILLAGLTIIFLLAVVTLQPFAIYSGGGQRVVVLVALLVCLIPTTIGALLSAIGIAGMDRLVQHNVLATSGRAVEAAGDVNTLLLDKTGTITLGNRQATEFVPINGVSAEAVADAAQLSSLADETPEGRSIVVLAKDEFGLRARDEGVMSHARFVPWHPGDERPRGGLRRGGGPARARQCAGGGYQGRLSGPGGRHRQHADRGCAAQAGRNSGLAEGGFGRAQCTQFAQGGFPTESRGGLGRLLCRQEAAAGKADQRRRGGGPVPGPDVEDVANATREFGREQPRRRLDDGRRFPCDPREWRGGSR